MRRGIAWMVFGLGALLASAAPAAADYRCVPNNHIPGCPVGAANENTVSDAFNNSHSGDTIIIAAGKYSEGTLDDMGKSLTILGAGPAKTVIQGKGTQVMVLSSHSVVSNLGLSLYTGAGNTGLSLAGTATHVAVTAAAGVTYGIGVQLNGGTFSGGSISLPLTASEPQGYGGVIGPGTIRNSIISAAVGVTYDLSGNMPAVHRDSIRGNQGVLVAGGVALKIDDSVIKTVSGAAPELGIGLSPQVICFGSFIARHLTVIGSGGAGSTGVSAKCDGAFGPATTSVTVDSSIIRNYKRSIYATATPGPYPNQTAK